MKKTLKILGLFLGFLFSLFALYITFFSEFPLISISENGVYIIGYGPKEDRSLIGYGEVFKKYYKKAYFQTMKDRTPCDKILKQYNKVGRLPFDKTFIKIGDLMRDAYHENCWNKKKSCENTTYTHIQARYAMERDVVPYHPAYFSPYKDFTAFEKVIYKEKYDKKEKEQMIIFWQTLEEFEKACKRTPWSDFVDYIRI